MGSILNPTPVTNGVSYSFDGSASDNYYSFTLHSNGNLLVSGSDGNNNFIEANIYDSNLAFVKSLVIQGGSESELLSAGDYFFQPIDSYGGSFSLSSLAMNGTPVLATTLTNGTSYSFDGSASDNYYSFTLNRNSNLIVAGSDGNNNYFQANIYDSNLAFVDELVVIGSESKSLSAGNYYIQPVDAYGGNFSLSFLATAPISATPLTNATSYNFSSFSSNNYYSFTLHSNGNVLLAGSASDNSGIRANIYDGNLTKIKDLFLDGSLSQSLSAGNYFIQPYDELGGSFSLSSFVMNGTPIQAKPLTNGTSYSFDGSASDNYYSFTLHSYGSVVVIGSDGNDHIAQVNIFDSNLTKMKTVNMWENVTGSSYTQLPAGDYFIQPFDDQGGTFSVSSSVMSSVNTAKLIDADGNLWDSIINVGDGSFVLQAASQTYRSYYGALGRLPDEGGYNWWLGEIEAGRHTLNSMAAGFIDSSEFKTLSDSDNSGVISNEEFILHMYNGVFGRDPDAGGLAWWVGQLDTEAKTQPDAFISMTQSNEYVELTVGTVADMMFY